MPHLVLFIYVKICLYNMKRLMEHESGKHHQRLFMRFSVPCCFYRAYMYFFTIGIIFLVVYNSYLTVRRDAHRPRLQIFSDTVCLDKVSRPHGLGYRFKHLGPVIKKFLMNSHNFLPFYQ